jgi:hypothetical protein
MNHGRGRCSEIRVEEGCILNNESRSGLNNESRSGLVDCSSAGEINGFCRSYLIRYPMLSVESNNSCVAYFRLAALRATTESALRAIDR